MNNETIDNLSENTSDKYMVKNTPEVLKKLFEIIGINYVDKEGLIDIEIDRNILLSDTVINKYNELKNYLKDNNYKSEYLTSLHSNNLEKQRFPAINILRQVLKVNGLRLKPNIRILGYNKNNGQKIIQRSFIIKLLDNDE